MSGVLDWLASLPPATLYLIVFVAAGLENIFPPLPADTVVAFGAFLAARGEGTILSAFLATWAGNLTGASLMYGAGRRYGAERIERRMLGDESGRAQSRMQALYGQYGLLALFLSRFLPGIRAVVPPFAGALRIPFLRALVVMGSASGLWYGFVSVVAFKAGSNFETLERMIARSGRIVALVSIVIVVIAAVIYWRREKRA